MKAPIYLTYIEVFQNLYQLQPAANAGEIHLYVRQGKPSELVSRISANKIMEGFLLELTSEIKQGS